MRTGPLLLKITKSVSPSLSKSPNFIQFHQPFVFSRPLFTCLMSCFPLFKKTVIDTGKLNANYRWTENNVLEIEGEAPMALHTFILEAEKHGLNVKYTKNTTIEIY